MTILFVMLFNNCAISKTNFEKTVPETTELNKLSEEFLQAIKNGNDTNAIQDRIANTTLTDLNNSLVTDAQKLAFWINIYNAYILVILSEKPELYNDKKDFFKKEQIPIAGRLLSFEKIEHGIIRKSQWHLGQGRIRKWFPNRLERALRASKRDYRIHFALNCGAKDCPPVAIYNPKELDEQLDLGTQRYLKQNSHYYPKKNEVAIAALFNWFRGDFGGKKGIKEILRENEIIPTTKDIDISYRNYDWTLDLDNWTSL